MKTYQIILAILLLSLCPLFSHAQFPGHFESITVKDGIKLTLIKGTEEKIDLHGSTSVQYYMDGNTLFIKAKGNFSGTARKVSLTYKSLNSISAYGGSSVSHQGTFNCNLLNVECNGGSSVKMNVDLATLALKSTGGGNIKISGKATTLSAEALSGGNIDGKSLKAKTVAARAVSGGNLTITALTTLSAEAISGGNIVYFGTPAAVSVNKKNGGNVSSPSGQKEGKKEKEKLY